MEQKDYLLREIEKIGVLMRTVFNQLAGRKNDFAFIAENQIEEAKGLLFQETGFDMDIFLSLTDSETAQYISKYDVLKGPNTELLADILKEMGMKAGSAIAEEYLRKALMVYELCSSIDKTFSFDRERKIRGIHNALS